MGMDFMRRTRASSPEFNEFVERAERNTAPGDVVDNLESDRADLPLSAKQGKVLNNKIDSQLTVSQTTAGVRYTDDKSYERAELIGRMLSNNNNNPEITFSHLDENSTTSKDKISLYFDGADFYLVGKKGGSGEVKKKFGSRVVKHFVLLNETGVRVNYNSMVTKNYTVENSGVLHIVFCAINTTSLNGTAVYQLYLNDVKQKGGTCNSAGGNNLVWFLSLNVKAGDTIKLTYDGGVSGYYNTFTHFCHLFETDKEKELLNAPIYLGTGTSFNVKDYPGFDSFTVDNFIVEPVGASVSNWYDKGSNTCKGYLNSYISLTKNYADGVLTAYVNGGMSVSSDAGGTLSVNGDVQGNVKAFLIL